jgi:hypothetical protein
MKAKSHRFRPEGLGPLERRLALTHGGPITPALIGTLSRTPAASGPGGRVVAQTNAAFDRFSGDYFQAQGAYLSSGAAQGTFVSFTDQRISLLAQELTRIFARLPGTFSYINSAHQRDMTGSDVLFQAILKRNINGTPPSSLKSKLDSNDVVPPPGTSGGGATLFSLTATNAIEAARTSMILAAKFIANGTFAKH